MLVEQPDQGVDRSIKLRQRESEREREGKWFGFGVKGLPVAPAPCTRSPIKALLQTPISGFEVSGSEV